MMKCCDITSYHSLTRNSRITEPFSRNAFSSPCFYQVCNFYNTLSAELLPSQKLMVLQPALAFEQLFNDKSGCLDVDFFCADLFHSFQFVFFILRRKLEHRTFVKV